MRGEKKSRPRPATILWALAVTQRLLDRLTTREGLLSSDQFLGTSGLNRIKEEELRG